jgi:FkbM family methyltransferase
VSDGTPPWWIAAGRRLIQSLPAGRFRAARLLARTRPAPFAARMPAEYGGALFWCDLSDAIARDACLIGAYEPPVTQIFTRLLRPGATVVDLGANWGYFTLMAAQLAGPGGRVLALEPDPRMFDLLERNVRLNGLTTVDAFPLAAGAGRATRTLAGYAEGTGNRGTSRIVEAEDSGLGARKPVVLRGNEQLGFVSVASEGDRFPEPRVPSPEPRFTVDTVPMDSFLDRHGLGSVDLIKIDVEGFEDAVLEGMAAGLARRRYRHLLIELHPALLAERSVPADRCCARLRAAGYSGWAVDHSPSAIRRAARCRRLPLAALITPARTVEPTDPWPHMLWTLEDLGPSREGARSDD